MKGLYDICGKEDDEDKDNQHNDTNYDQHFNVFPPVFPGNACGCSLKRVSLEKKKSPIKQQKFCFIFETCSNLVC